MFRPVDRHGTIAVGRLSPAGANRIVQRAVRRTGTDPGPSLPTPSGLGSPPLQAGVAERATMSQTGHRSVIVARGYIRTGSLFRDNAAAQVGL
jgi:hypothetical protein